jgi:hypothetical protein
VSVPATTAPEDQPCGTRRRGRPKKLCSESSVAYLPAVPLGKLGIKGKRGRGRGRWHKGASFTASSSSSTSPQSLAMEVLESESEWRASDDESQSESDYELVESSTSIIL